MRKRLLVIVVAVALTSVAVVLVLHRGSAPEAVTNASSATSNPRQLWHCGMHPQVIEDHPGDCPICHMALTPILASDSASGAAIVSIDPLVVQNMGVRTAIVTRGPLHVTITAVGMLAVPQPAIHDVSLRVSGWVEKLYADTEGMHVHKDEVLFDLYSPDLQVAAQELISASHARKTLPAEANAELQKDADDLLASAKRKLILWGIASGDVDAIASLARPPGTVPIRSPADGDIVDDAIVQGSAVQAGARLMRIEDHSRLWLDAQVFEEQIPFVAVGLPVSATMVAFPGKTFAGKISFIYPHLDHMTRTDIVRATLENPDQLLKPGMYATVQIMTRPVADALLVPREAVIDTGTRKLAFVARGEGHFEPRIVKTGFAGDGDQVQILEGLSAGEAVVTSGQFLMDVESRTNEAIGKLGASPPQLLHSDATSRSAR